MKFESRSQAGQDRFVHALLPKTDGTFLEIGSNHPIDINNTFALEQLGWRGLLVDNDEVCARLCREKRLSPVIEEDATVIEWNDKLFGHAWCTNARKGERETICFERPTLDTMLIDYLSLDVDQASLAALVRLPLAKVRFNVITIEHDAYRFGSGPRDAMRALLHDAGYIIVAADVQDQGMAFEDWWLSTAAIRNAPRGIIPCLPNFSCDWRRVVAAAEGES